MKPFTLILALVSVFVLSANAADTFKVDLLRLFFSSLRTGGDARIGAQVRSRSAAAILPDTCSLPVAHLSFQKGFAFVPISRLLVGVGQAANRCFIAWPTSDLHADGKSATGEATGNGDGRQTGKV
jgi:hypothetical protein